MRFSTGTKKRRIWGAAPSSSPVRAGGAPSRPQMNSLPVKKAKFGVSYSDWAAYNQAFNTTGSTFEPTGGGSSLCNMNGGNTSRNQVARIANGKFGIIYSYLDTAGTTLSCKFVVGTISGKTITWGSPVTLPNAFANNSQWQRAVVRRVSDTVVVVCGACHDGTNYTPRAVAISISGTTATCGSITANLATTSGSGDTVEAVRLDDTHALVTFYDANAGGISGRVLTFSGSTISSTGTITSLTGDINKPDILLPISSTQVLRVYSQGGTTVDAQVLTVDTSTVTASGTALSLNVGPGKFTWISNTNYSAWLGAAIGTDRFLVTLIDGTTGINVPKFWCLGVSGTTVSQIAISKLLGNVDMGGVPTGPGNIYLFPTNAAGANTYTGILRWNNYAAPFAYDGNSASPTYGQILYVGTWQSNDMAADCPAAVHAGFGAAIPELNLIVNAYRDTSANPLGRARLLAIS